MAENVKPRYYRNLHISGMHSAGRSFAFCGGRKVFVDYALPGEVVDAVAPVGQGKFTVAQTVKVKKKSAYRVEPACPYFGVCGGCNWQHIAYDEQLRLKRNILIEALKKHNVEAPEISLPHASPLLQHYRNKIEYTFTNEPYVIKGQEKEQQKVSLGFHLAMRPDKVLDVGDCCIQPPYARQITAAAKQLANSMGFDAYNSRTKTGLLKSLQIRTSTLGKTLVIVTFAGDYNVDAERYLTALYAELPESTSLLYAFLKNEGDELFNSVLHPFAESAYCFYEQINEVNYQVHAKSFFQPNPLQAVNLYRSVLNYANLTGNQRVLDLYTGIGSIACYLAPYAKEVLGIEASVEAIADANENTIINGLVNTRFFSGDVLTTFTPDFVNKYGKFDVIVLDPPRAGTLIEVKKTIFYAAPQQIIYVSCNPVSLARDLSQLSEFYHVTCLEMFDMFPHTPHVETVAVLIKKDLFKMS